VRKMINTNISVIKIKKIIIVRIVLFVLIVMIFMISCKNKTTSGPSLPANTATITATYTNIGTVTDTSTPTITQTITDTDTATATATITPTFTITDTPCVVAGYSGGNSGTYQCHSNTIFQQVAVAGSGTIKKIYIYVNASSKSFQAAVYSDVSNCPGSILTISSSQQLSGTGWMALDVPDLAVSAGNYWLAFTSNEGLYGVNTSVSGYTLSVLDPGQLPTTPSCSFYENYANTAACIYASCE